MRPRNGLYAELCAKQFIGQEPEAEPDWMETVQVRDVMSRDMGLVPEELPLEDVAPAALLRARAGVGA